MRVDLLQCLAICTYGNLALRDESGQKPSELRVFQSTFKNLYELGFERSGNRGLMSGTLADGTSGFFKRLKQEGAEGLQLYLTGCEINVHDQKVPWGIVAETDRGCEIWQPTWKMRAMGPSDTTPWRVMYNAEKVSRWDIPQPVSYEAASEALATTINSSIELLRAEGPKLLSMPLERVLQLHEKGNLEAAGYSDLMPENAPFAARLIAATSVKLCALLLSNAWKVANPISQEPTLMQQTTKDLWKVGMQLFETATALSAAESAPGLPIDLADLPQAS